ncbi:MAG: DUF4832 domain-containing protein [Byssovorax sp.]
MTLRRARALAAVLALAAPSCGEPRKSPAPDAAPIDPPPRSAAPVPVPVPGPVPATSASAKDPEEEILVVRPRLIDDLLVNPGIGLQTFQRFDGQPLNPPLTWSEAGPVDPPADAPARADFPASSIAYFRWFWSQIEPAPGALDLGIVDRAIAAARAHGQTLSFRIMPYDPGHPLPAWLLGEGLRRAPLDPGEEGRGLHPDYADPLYARRWGELIAGLAARYDGHPQIDTLDMSSIGYWGEGGGPHPPSFPVRKGFLDAWLDAFKETPLLVNFDEERGMAHAAGRGAGIRLDCLGDLRTLPEGQGGWSHMRSLYPQEIVRSGVQNVWQKHPIALESCWTPAYWKQHGWDVTAILAQALRWHASALNVKSTPIPAEHRRAFEDFLRRAGYRLELRQITYPKAVKVGSMMPVHLHWFNAGVAPPYRPWVVALALATPESTTVIKLPADVRTWLPDDAVIDTSVYVPETLAHGTYHLRVALLDPRTGAPAVRLGIEGRKPDGWYDLGWISLK